MISLQGIDLDNLCFAAVRTLDRKANQDVHAFL